MTSEREFIQLSFRTDVPLNNLCVHKIWHLLTFTQAWNFEILKTTAYRRMNARTIHGTLTAVRILFGQPWESTHSTPQAKLSKNLHTNFMWDINSPRFMATQKDCSCAGNDVKETDRYILPVFRGKTWGTAQQHNNLACSVGRDVNREPEHTLPGAAPTDVAALRRYRVPQHLSSPLATTLRHDTNWQPAAKMPYQHRHGWKNIPKSGSQWETWTRTRLANNTRLPAVRRQIH